MAKRARPWAFLYLALVSISYGAFFTSWFTKHGVDTLFAIIAGLGMGGVTVFMVFDVGRTLGRLEGKSDETQGRS